MLPCTRHTAHGTRHTAHGTALKRVTAFGLFCTAAFWVGAQSITISLTASDFNSFNISCFGLKDGAIDATVTGGTPPYTFEWSNGPVTADNAGLPSGYYKLVVTDANSETAEADITLVEPMQMKVTADSFKYPSGLNISCNECYNGSIDITVDGGVPPYVYDWHDEVLTQDRSGLGALNYAVTVTDDNGCETKSETIPLKQPDSDDWKMGGNANTDPATQYFGTSDAQDVVIKSNATEQLRLKSNGDIQVHGSLVEEGPIYRDGDGVLKVGGGPWGDVAPPSNCGWLRNMPYWRTTGNNFFLCPEEDRPRFGTISDDALRIITTNVERMHVKPEGNIWMATTLMLGMDLEEGEETPYQTRLGIRSSSTASWLSLLTEDDNTAWHMRRDEDGLFFNYMQDQNGSAHAVTLKLWNDRKVSIGDVSVNTTYEYGLYVWKGILTEKVKVAIRTESQWSDHVFDTNYSLMPLTDVDRFIKANGHLPNVPTAACMVEQGLDVVKTDAMLMEKIEELTLHAIQLNERLTILEQENLRLKRLIR